MLLLNQIYIFFFKQPNFELYFFIKVWFTLNNKTGCRFIVVDAYN